jgi:hypothetical protein
LHDISLSLTSVKYTEKHRRYLLGKHIFFQLEDYLFVDLVSVLFSFKTGKEKEESSHSFSSLLYELSLLQKACVIFD